MTPLPPSLKKADPKLAVTGIYKNILADCIVLTHDGRLLLQQRPLTWKTFPGHLMAFGGHVDPGETPLEGVCRELNEELEAEPKPDDVVFLGAVTEDFTNHTEVVFVHFWHDKAATVKGCHEGAPRYYKNAHSALQHPKALDYLKWGLLECVNRGLIE